MRKGIQFIPDASLHTSKVGEREFKYQVPNPKKEEWDSYWDSVGEEGDVYFPYWLETWNSAFALYTYLEKQNFDLMQNEILEVAGGSGVLSQLLIDKITKPYLFSDFVPEAVRFAKRQIDHPMWNALVLDVQNSSVHKKFDVIIASDCLYQSDLAPLFCEFFKEHLTLNGRALVADPNRMGVEAFKDLKNNWSGTIELIHWPLMVDGHNRDYQIFELKL